MGETLATLIVLFAVAGGALILILPKFGAPSGEMFAARSIGNPAGTDRALRRIRGTGLLVGLAGALAFHWHRSALLLWWSIVVVLGGAAVASILLDRPFTSPPARGRLREVLLWSIAVVCVVLTLICHRWDPDDSFYINLAVAAADLPGWALLSTDTLHGIDGLPLHFPLYRLQSYEVLNGALSYLTGIPAIYCFHWIAASVAALFVPLAHAKLLRVLTPRLWPWVLAIQIFVLFAIGETHRWYGNFAFVRMWQGKSIFLSVFTPLICAYAMRFAQRPSRRGWLLLGAAQIGALGCNVTAIWAAPVGAFMALCCALRPTREGVRTLALGTLASAYLVGVGLLLLVQTKSVSGSLQAFSPPAPGVRLGEALVDVLGDSRLLILGIAAIAVTWTCCSRGLLRRFTIVLPLVVWTVLLNPYIDQFVSMNVVGGAYWRILWAIPVPLLITFLLTSPLQLIGHTSQRVLGPVVCLLLLVAFAAFVPRFSGISKENRVILKSPGLKVPHLYEWAEFLCRNVPPRSQVVAQELVAQYVTTFHDHPYPVKVRHYLDPNAALIDAEDYRYRDVMTRYVTGYVDSEDTPMIFRDGLDRFAVEGVCLRESEHAKEARVILQEVGLRRVAGGRTHEIWLRGRLEDPDARPEGRIPDPVFNDGFESGDRRQWSRER